MSALVAGGGIGLGLSLVAHANVDTSCDSSTTAPITCTLPDTANPDTTINTPSAIQAVVDLNSGSPAQYVQVTYSLYCSQGGAQATTTQATAPALPVDQAISVGNPVTDNLVLGETSPDSCTVETLTATLYTDNAATTLSTSGSFTMFLEWTPASTPSATTSSSSPPPSVNVSTIRGYDGKCLDDKGNSSANRAEVIIWTCNSGDSAQGFTFSGGELKHNGKCVNDQGNVGSGGKLILWTCNGASNEKWFHSSSDGEFVMDGTSHGLQCVDDPGYSKTNGTQLIVYTCHNTSNQHWS